MANTKSLGIAYTDQALQDGTMSGYTITGGTISGAVISGTVSGTGSFGNLTATGNVVLGDATTDTIGFYGATPAAQPTSSNEAAAATTAAVSVSATQWGFSTSTQANAIVTLVNQLRADLVTLGIIKGS